MARARNPNREKAKQVWLNSGGTKKLKEIAKEIGCSDSQIRKWKSQDKWENELKGNVPNGNSNVTNEKKRYQSAKGNQNAKGNLGNPNASPPPNNQNAISHGLFAKYLPDDTKALIAELYTSDPADIIWNNIMIQYSAIIRAQKIMYVHDEFDTTEWEKKRKGHWIPDKKGNSIFVPNEIEKEIQFSWDKQASFILAQSRAMGTLSNLIKQFVAIADEKDERCKRLEFMQSQIDKAKAETSKLRGEGPNPEAADWEELLNEVEQELSDSDE